MIPFFSNVFRDNSSVQEQKKPTFNTVSSWIKKYTIAIKKGHPLIIMDSLFISFLEPVFFLKDQSSFILQWTEWNKK